MKKLITLFLLMTMLLVLFAGCGKSEVAGGSEATGVSDSGEADVQDEASEESTATESESDSDSGDDNNGDAASAQGFISTADYKVVLSTFKEFGYDYNTKKADSDSKLSFSYVLLGTESIDGVDTEHLKVTIFESGEAKEYEAWYDKEWSAVKFKNSEGEKTGDDASMAAGALTMMTQMYCNLSTIYSSYMTEDGTVSNDMFEIKDKSKENLDLGNGGSDMELYNLSGKIGDVDSVLGITSINGKKMYVVLETLAKDKSTLDGMRITRAVLR